MNLQTFVINNIGVIVAIIVAIGSLFHAIISKNKQQVFTDIYGLISDAEQVVGASNLDKFKIVFDQAYTKFPGFIKLFINEDDIKRGIEYALAKIKSYSNQQIAGTPINATVEVTNAAPALTAEELTSLTSIIQKLQPPIVV